MKNTILTLASLLLLISASAQTNTKLRIYHKMNGIEPFAFNTTMQNNNLEDFQITRLAYYLTRFTVVHDGGQQTAISDDTVALFGPTDGPFSEIDLGDLNVNNVEAIRFHIGVHSPANNEDPAQYPAGHPLAPQAPSMHWGWAAGYRFLVYEGNGGSNFSQMFQMHTLWNANYMEATVNVTDQDVNNANYIVLDADYSRGAENINTGAGIFAHGVDQEDLTVLQNFIDYVFTSSTETLVADLAEESIVDWVAYPNPSNGTIYVKNEVSSSIDYVVTDVAGRTIANSDASNGQVIVSGLESGTYLIEAFDAGQSLGTQTVIVK